MSSDLPRESRVWFELALCLSIRGVIYSLELVFELKGVRVSDPPWVD